MVLELYSLQREKRPSIIYYERKVFRF